MPTQMKELKALNIHTMQILPSVEKKWLWVPRIRWRTNKPRLALASYKGLLQYVHYFLLECLFQPNNKYCGYYVIQFMKDVVTHDQIYSLQTIYLSQSLVYKYFTFNPKRGRRANFKSTESYLCFFYSIEKCNQNITCLK